MTRLSRRRFLTISAACTAFPATAATSAHWSGVALGARASLRLEGLSAVEAAPIFTAVEAELRRLEDIFSLYRPNSQISLLNRDGVLSGPAPDFLSVLSLCSVIHTASGGVFDPTVQPLWMALAAGASADVVNMAQQSIGWDKVQIGTDAIRLPQPGLSAITLNGIAQGAITDRIAALLRSYGLRNVLVDMGEVAALGRRSDGSPWSIGLANAHRKVARRITLTDRAVATSSPGAMRLSDDQGHILHPRGNAPIRGTVSVSAPETALADGLSTALCLLSPKETNSVLTAFPEAHVELIA